MYSTVDSMHSSCGRIDEAFIVLFGQYPGLGMSTPGETDAAMAIYMHNRAVKRRECMHMHSKRHNPKKGQGGRKLKREGAYSDYCRTSKALLVPCMGSR